MKKTWSIYEDEYCCTQFVEKYIINRDFMDSSTFVYNLALKLKNLDTGTIKMKVSNIVYIVNFLKIKHTCDLAPLSNFSTQNLELLGKTLVKYNIDIDKQLLIKLIQSKYNTN